MALSNKTLSSKHRLVPGFAAITFKPANAGSGTAIQFARQRPLSESERAVVGVRLGISDANWILPAEELGGVVPVAGDSITEAGGTLWLIESVESGLLASEYKCYAVKGR